MKMKAACFLSRPLSSIRRVAAPCAALACVAGFLLVAAVAPVFHASVAEDVHGHTAPCKWVKDAQLYNPRSAHAQPPVLPDGVTVAAALWIFTGLIACRSLPRLPQNGLFRFRSRAPPRIPVFPQ
jgi:hypothetical protein